MEVELKQRLVGASVIIALAVIFIPMIFENTHVNQNQSISIEIPDEPKGLKHKILNIDTSQVTGHKTQSETQSEVKPSDNITPQSNLENNSKNTKPIIKTQEKIIDLVDNSDKNNIVPQAKPVVKEEIKQAKPEIIIKKEPVKAAEPKLVSNPDESDNTYRVKFGVFSQEKNAQQLKAKLINSGFVAIVEKDESKQTYKVYSKQLNSKSAAQNLSKNIQKLKLNIGKPAIETLTEEDRMASEMLLDTGWIIQIGIFSSKVNSVKLRDKIRNKGFVSFVDEIKNSKNETRYRVRIGPFATRDEAQVELKNIKTKMNLKGLIKPHEKRKVI